MSPARARAAPPSDADRSVVDGYPSWPDKGEERDGYRLTVLTATLRAAVGEPVRVVHVVESTDAAHPLFVMGPKEVLGELVDGAPATDPVPQGQDALEPASYDGRVLPGPGVDAHYDVTEYVFDEPGTHTVQWAPGGRRSNVLTVEVG
ncbi:hypothetical protein H9657_10950 [Cellulomonas sp. Sa3CUA2]|uniref:Uncharacterized protein n=1 Tax=Cellulomonas avistercoris TaxID=2762242 RepID=A0ABR8QEQ7_9CELL|nr:hypothetical protein [Cellulomonas avistercoris]MBD7918789.1 hypothetical protein [Cellulomonas avistercoris]